MADAHATRPGNAARAVECPSTIAAGAARETVMTSRMRRINESVQQVLSEAVGRLKDPRIGFVTVTGVETTTDLRHARVFVSVLGVERKRVQTLEALQA